MEKTKTEKIIRRTLSDFFAKDEDGFRAQVDEQEDIDLLAEAIADAILKGVKNENSSK